MCYGRGQRVGGHWQTDILKLSEIVVECHAFLLNSISKDHISFLMMVLWLVHFWGFLTSAATTVKIVYLRFEVAEMSDTNTYFENTFYHMLDAKFGSYT